MQATIIQQALSQTAEKFGARVAAQWQGAQITYAELEQRTNRLANFLISSGINKGSIVGIFVRDRLRLIEMVIGVLKAGCVFVPLDASEPPKRLELMTDAIKPELYLIEAAFYDRLGALAAAARKSVKAIVINKDHGFTGGSENIDELPGIDDFNDDGSPTLAIGPDDMCYIFFTSGSTGIPKPIAGRLGSLWHFVQWEIETFNIDHTAHTSQLAVPTFDAYLRDIFVPLCAGATVYIPENRETILDTQKLLRWLDEKQINLVHCVPSVFRAMAREKLGPQQLQSLKYLIMAGEHIAPVEVKKWMDVFGQRVQLVNLYGATENTMAKFCHFIQETDQHRRSIPIGKPIDGARAIILDERGRLCDPGVTGEIYIRTPFLTLGYYNRPDLTGEVFVPNPLTGNRQDIVYKTGDLGRLLADGNFELIGRKDQQVKILGQRVELGEIESILKRHPAIREAAVAVKGHDPESHRLVAYIITDSDRAPAIGELQNYLQEALPQHMVPSGFVTLDAMPLTRTGKIDRNALPEPDWSHSLTRAEFIAPRTPIEETLAEIWAAVLRHRHFGIHDNFFQLGGHSLMATQVISRVRESFQVEVPLRELFETPTIAGLAAAIERACAEQQSLSESQALSLVEGLSDKEIDLMLARLSDQPVDVTVMESFNSRAISLPS